MLYDCPECALPCTVEPYGSAMSTDGPVAIARVRCLTGHWFHVPARTYQETPAPGGPAPARIAGRQ
jgi:hypothetical protein